MIDWITVGAQALNFLILVVLLKVFLYDRILQAIDKRRSAVRERFDQARKEEAQAQERARELKEKNEKIEQERDRLIQEAREEADQLRTERLEQARKDVEAQQKRWLQSMEDQRADFLSDLRRQVARQVRQLTGKVLSDLAGADLHRQAVDALARRIPDAGEETRNELRQLLSGNGEPVEVATAFELDDEQADRVRHALGELAEGTPEIRFVQDDDLVCGIQLRAGGHAVGWNMAEYLDQLAEEIGEAMDERVRSLRQSQSEAGQTREAEGREAGEEQEGGEPGEDKNAEPEKSRQKRSRTELDRAEGENGKPGGERAGQEARPDAGTEAGDEPEEDENGG